MRIASPMESAQLKLTERAIVLALRGATKEFDIHEHAIRHLVELIDAPDAAAIEAIVIGFATDLVEARADASRLMRAQLPDKITAD